MEEIILVIRVVEIIIYFKLNLIRNVQKIYKEYFKISKGYERKFSKQVERCNYVKM